MDESKIIADILERLDRAIEHIIVIKSDMYKASDFRLDSVRIYDAIAKVQSECGAALRVAVSAIDLTDADQEQRLSKIERMQIPPWVWAIIGTFLGAISSAVIQGIIGAMSAKGHL
jgi:hypothetical protein